MIKQTEQPAVVPLVLVVEDDWVIKALIHDILESEGFQVFAVETADEAWHFLVENPQSVDLIFSDIHLPGLLGGIDLANLAYGRWPQLPVILSSGISGQQALESGCVPIFVPKPWHSLDIGAVCRRALMTGRETAR